MFETKRCRSWLLMLCGLVVTMAVPDVSQAMPAFARANKVPCTTCHVQFPKLNDFGMAFKQNGYRMEGKKGEFVWTKDNLPLASVATITYETVDTGADETATVDRRALEVFSGGSLGPEISYFFDFGFSSDQLTTSPGGDTVDVTTAAPGGTFLILNNLLPDNLANLRVGVMSNEFFYLSVPRRTTLSDYKAPVSVDHTGIELNGIAKGNLRYAVGFGNDEMVGVTDVTNNMRGGFGWATYNVAGQTVGARFIAAKAGAAKSADETHTQWDVNADLHLGPANLAVGYYMQDNVAGVQDDKQTNLLAEVVYPLTPKVLLTGRYEAQDTETGGAEVAGTDQILVVNTSLFLLPNVNLQAEFSTADNEESATEENRFILGFRVGI
ncbi:MAG: hypothetical protein HZA24_04305 [Nitrospirae bacterium]|nr:hypothetical protein [Nitrospirota bacterium]